MKKEIKYKRGKNGKKRKNIAIYFNKYIKLLYNIS